MSPHKELLRLEAAFDGPIPPAALAARNQTPEQARARKLASLKDSVEFYGRKLAEVRAAQPGAVIGNIVHTADMLVKAEAALVTQLDRVSREFHDFAMAETHAALDRAAGYDISFKDAAE